MGTRPSASSRRSSTTVSKGVDISVSGEDSGCRSRVSTLVSARGALPGTVGDADGVVADHVATVVGGPRPGRGAARTRRPAESLRLWRLGRPGRQVADRFGRSLGLPLSVPGWRREHRPGLGELEPERYLCAQLRQRVRAAGLHSDVPVLRAVPEQRQLQLVQREPEEPDQPEYPGHDAGLLPELRVLMKRLGPGMYDGIQGFGKTAVINVEPDFSGGYTVQAVNNPRACFSFCSGSGNDPNLLRAAVASSGFPDVAGIPDTYSGFTLALAHLRDLYAPNVLIGYEVSPWAPGTDVGVDPNPNLDGAALGQQVGVFLNKLGPHELLFNNPLDRDAGQYRAQFGQNRWWDRLNAKYPNFSRWEQFVHGAAAADGNKPMLLWQVPVGNQYFQSENNTDGHFQDNRAEYIFAHVPELMDAGIVGALFGAGNAGNTTYGDSKKDGVTNPPAICVTDGISSGQICNDHPSTVADDDGGYIRMMGHSYFQSPLPLTGAAAAAIAPLRSAAPAQAPAPVVPP